ncbi:MAG: sulfatase-like hydrolase/transferase [Vulcanimicrobiota bacterium]
MTVLPARNGIFDSMATYLVIAGIIGTILAYYLAGKVYKRKKILSGIFKPLLVLAFLSLVTTLGIYGYNTITGKKDSKNISNKPNIIILSYDSLNIHHMSVYGYSRETTPNLKNFAQNSYLFSRMKCNINSTSEALKAMSGLAPGLDNSQSKSLMEMLQPYYPDRKFISFTNYGKDFNKDFTRTYHVNRFDATETAGFLYRDNPANREMFFWLADFFSENFKFYNLFYLIDPRNMNLKTGDPYPQAVYFDIILNSLKRDGGGVFIWAHFFEPHLPYLTPEQFNKNFGDIKDTYKKHILATGISRQFIIDRYDSAILYLDHEFGNFIAELKRKDLYNNSIIIITSDHGESLLDTSKKTNITLLGHKFEVLTPTITDIPFILHLPGQKQGEKISTFATQLDIAPTLLEILSLQIPHSFAGESLVPYLNEPDKMSEKVKFTVSETLFDNKQNFYIDDNTLKVYFGKYIIEFLISGEEKEPRSKLLYIENAMTGRELDLNRNMEKAKQLFNSITQNIVIKHYLNYTSPNS